MAEEAVARSYESEAGEVEVKDRGFFNFGGKKEENKDEEQEQALTTKMGKVHFEDVEQPTEEADVEKKHTLRDKLNSSGSSSSSDEEEGEGENKERRRKKKGLKERINEKMHGDDCKEGEGEGEVEVGEVEVEEKENCLKELKEKVDVVPPAAVGQHEDTEVVVEKVEETEKVEQVAPEDEKKGFLEKIKEKLPGHHKKTYDEVATATPLPPPPAEVSPKEHEGEKKGFLEKIKEKLPGYHSNKNGEEETEKNAAGH